MDSRRPNRLTLLTPLRLIQSGKAAFSLKAELAFLKQNSSAGVIAGVFFGHGAAGFRAPSMAKHG
jgi:hypothetical protein